MRNPKPKPEPVKQQKVDGKSEGSEGPPAVDPESAEPAQVSESPKPSPKPKAKGKAKAKGKGSPKGKAGPKGKPKGKAKAKGKDKQESETKEEGDGEGGRSKSKGNRDEDIPITGGKKTKEKTTKGRKTNPKNPSGPVSGLIFRSVPLTKKVISAKCCRDCWQAWMTKTGRSVLCTTTRALGSLE